MPVGKKLAIVLSVVMVGASVAFLFRKDPSAFRFWESGPEDPFDRPVERRVTADAAWPDRGTATSNASSQPARRVAQATTAAISEPNGPASGGQPKFTSSVNPVGALLPPIEGIVGDEGESDAQADWTSAGERSTDPAGQTLRHIVVDGDTLSNLAARYLGRAEDYLEIFRLNRDVLANPELLPIGVVLRIPSRGRSVGEGESPLRMVPVTGRAG